MTGWMPIETAPRDGRVFIARNADHPNWGSWPMLRNVKWSWDETESDYRCEDLGAWLHVLPIEPDYEEGHDVGAGRVPYSIASDEYNRSVRYEWMPLPPPPGEES